MKRTWIYLNNPILVATEDSYRLAVRISTWHDSALLAASADPFIAGLYAGYHPIHLKFVEAYNEWVAQGGMQQGETLNLKQLLKLESNTKINAWDSGIQAVYAKGTPQYKALLPNGHAPFQKGTQTQRFSVVKALSDAINGDAALAAVKADVDAFFLLLNGANTSQKGSKSTTNAQSDAVEAARINMSVAQYADLGQLIGAHADDTSLIDQYFDLEAIRTGQQVFFEGHVKENSIHTILKHKFSLTDTLLLRNVGTTELQFFFTSDKNGKVQKPIILQPGTEEAIGSSGSGSLSEPILRVFNPNTLVKGEFVVEFI